MVAPRWTTPENASVCRTDVRRILLYGTPTRSTRGPSDMSFLQVGPWRLHPIRRHESWRTDDWHLVTLVNGEVLAPTPEWRNKSTSRRSRRNGPRDPMAIEEGSSGGFIQPD